jgi:hypothetical protein
VAPEATSAAYPFVLRVIAWIVSVPVGFVVVIVAARKSGWLSGQRLVDVVTTGEGIRRYFQWRVLVLAPVWAVITTVLWYGIAAGGLWLIARRHAIRAGRAERAERARGSDDSSDDQRDDALAGAGARTGGRASGGQRAGRNAARRGAGS